MGNNKPRVSIGMPVYNGERYIKEAVDSILAQTYEDFELIISDNASTDSTQEICQSYARKDRRIRYYRNTRNLGAAKNFNRVFELSKGKYFKWASYDDICASMFLEQCVEILNQNPSVVLCYPRTIIIDENGKLTDKRFDDDLNLCFSTPSERFSLFISRYSPWGMCFPIFGLIRTEVLKKTPLIRNFIGSDMILLGELALRGEFYEVPSYLFYRRDHPYTSVRAYTDLSELTSWFDTSKRKRIYFPTWRWLYEYILTIMRVQLSWFERAYCLTKTCNWFIQNRKRFVRELKTAIKIAIRNLLIRSEIGKKMLERRRQLLINIHRR